MRLRDALRILSRAMSLSPFGGSCRKSCGVSDVFVCCLVDGLDASSGVAGVTSGAGGVGVGVGVAALPQKNDMQEKKGQGLSKQQSYGEVTDVFC